MKVYGAPFSCSRKVEISALVNIQYPFIRSISSPGISIVSPSQGKPSMKESICVVTSISPRELSTRSMRNPVRKFMNAPAARIMTFCQSGFT